jgi:hypothetical protein
LAGYIEGVAGDPYKYEFRVCLLASGGIASASARRSAQKRTQPDGANLGWGPWRIQTVENNLAALPCGKSLAVRDAGFTVSQSGKNFTLNFGHSLASSDSGTIEGTTIKASMSPSTALAGDAGCGGERVFLLTATVDSKVKPRSLAGMLSVKNCPNCAPVQFLAIREDQAKAEECH